MRHEFVSYRTTQLSIEPVVNLVSLLAFLALHGLPLGLGLQIKILLVLVPELLKIIQKVRVSCKQEESFATRGLEIDHLLLAKIVGLEGHNVAYEIYGRLVHAKAPFVKIKHQP